MQEVIKSQQLNQEIVKVQHPSGLTLLLCPMKGFSTAYATFTTQYGSVDTAFKTQDDDEMLQVPQGIAHFLEHKKMCIRDRYKAHGIQRIGVKQGLDKECVISPYSTFLTLPLKLDEGIKNLEKLENLGMLGYYGFYEGKMCIRDREYSVTLGVDAR